MQKILLIEDDAFYAKQIQKALLQTFENMQIDWVQTAQEAEEAARNQTYDLAISDLILPDSEGDHIQRLIDKSIKTVAVTGGSDLILRDKTLQLNIVDFIVKSGDPKFHYLTTLIRRLLNNIGKNILIVEDSEAIRKMYRKMLQVQNLTIFEAQNGVEALKILEKEPIDLVLSDYHMPQMDGLRLLGKIRRRFSMVELPFIAVSSNEENDTVARFLKQGANDYLQKPFGKEELLCRINNTLDTMEMVENIRRSAITDSLTGLANRHYFYEIAPQMIGMAERYEDQTLSVLMADIDHFKSFNDTYGHLTGDKVLAGVAEVIRKNVRQADVPIRFGGEEFLIFLPHTDLRQAFITAEKLRRNVQKLSLRSETGEPLKVTISAGVAQYRKGMSLNDLIKAADEALYAAKRNGRNRVELGRWDEGEESE